MIEANLALSFAGSLERDFTTVMAAERWQGSKFADFQTKLWNFIVE